MGQYTCQISQKSNITQKMRKPSANACKDRVSPTYPPHLCKRNALLDFLLQIATKVKKFLSHIHKESRKEKAMDDNLNKTKDDDTEIVDDFTKSDAYELLSGCGVPFDEFGEPLGIGEGY